MSSGSQRRRLVRHHLPIALASGLVLLLWMMLPLLQTSGHQAPPQPTAGAHPTPAASAPPSDHGAPPQAAGHQGPPVGHSAQASPSPHQAADAESDPIRQERAFTARLTTATGYVATGLLGLTLLIGPVNLMLRRRNPVSSYLRRDVGAWTAIFSVIHVIAGLQVHGPPGPFLERVLRYFVGPDGAPLTDAFGLGNWTGLAATVMVLVLLAISSDFALRQLKAGRWKWLQRLNYALFALVVAHALYYGALLRTTSVSTIMLGVSVAAVLVGQGIGIRLWRRR